MKLRLIHAGEQRYGMLFQKTYQISHLLTFSKKRLKLGMQNFSMPNLQSKYLACRFYLKIKFI